MKKNHKRHKESLAPHVDVPVNVNNVELKPKNSTRSTMFQGLEVEQSQRQVDGILQKDKKRKEKKEEDEKKGGKKGVEKKAVKKGAVEPTKKTQIKEVDLVTEQQEVWKGGVYKKEEACSKQDVEKKEVKKGPVEPNKKSQIKEELLQEDNWNYEKKEKLKEVTLKQKNEKCRE